MAVAAACAPAPPADKGCTGLCGAAPAAPGFLFEGKDHASARRRGQHETFPRPIRGANPLQTAPGPMGLPGRAPWPRRGAPGRARPGLRGAAVARQPLTGALPPSPVPRGASPTRGGALPTPRGASCPTHPPPRQAGRFVAALPAAFSALSPPCRLWGCSRAPRSTLELLGKRWRGFPPVLHRPGCARSHAGAPHTPPPWVPANPNEHNRPPQRSRRGTGPPTAWGEEGANQPCTPLQPPARLPLTPLPRGGHSQRGPSTQRGSGSGGVHRVGAAPLHPLS